MGSPTPSLMHFALSNYLFGKFHDMNVFKIGRSAFVLSALLDLLFQTSLAQTRMHIKHDYGKERLGHAGHEIELKCVAPVGRDRVLVSDKAHSRLRIARGGWNRQACFTDLGQLGSHEERRLYLYAD